MRPNRLVIRCLLSLIAVSVLGACHSVKTPPCNEIVLSFIEPQEFYVKKLSQDNSDQSQLYWTFVYSKSTKSVKICDNLAADRRLREFNVLCAFQDGKRVFYKEFYDAYDPYTLNKGFTTRLDHFNGQSPIRFYWYNVILFSDGEEVALKKQIISESGPFKVDYDAGAVDIISEQVMVGKLTERHGWVETPLSWIDSWVDKIKKQKINKPF